MPRSLRSGSGSRHAKGRRARRLALPCLLAWVSLVACDKTALRENVRPLDGQPSNVGAGDRDASVGESFVPTPADAGEDRPNAPSPGDGDTNDASTPSEEPVCGRGPSADTAFSKRALLESIASCTTQQLCEARLVAEDFAVAALAYDAQPNDETQRRAKDAWYFALKRWQIAELFRFGPAAPTMEPGGQSLRDQIYAFPTTSRCTLEEQIVKKAYEGSAFAGVPFNARGFGAAEYLLFFAGSSNSCSAFSALNYPAPGSWAALSTDELAARKRAYLAAVASDLSSRTRTLLGAWQPGGDDFARELATAGHGSSVYATEQSGLNAVSHALFYLDKEVKDWKIGRPAGLMECSANCASYAESPYALVGADHVRANLEGFRLLFQGCAPEHAGLGFDDWLRAVGMGALADDMLAALDGAEAAMKGFPLDQRLVDDPSAVLPVHQAIKHLTDLLKVDFVSALDLEIPMALEGDND